MAGISSDRPPGLQLGPIQNIAPRSTVAPISDFMEAFRNGFITIDDINKRTMATANQATATKTNIAAQDLQRRQIAGQSELLPGQIQNAQASQAVDAVKIEGQGAIVPLQNEVATRVLQDEADELNPDPAVRQAAGQRKTERQFQQLFGTPPPDTIQVPDTGVIAASFEDWYQANKAPQVAAAATGAGGTDQDRAAVFNQLEAQKTAPETQAEYQDYVASTKNRVVPIAKGEPEYNEILRNQIQQKLRGVAVEQAQLKALPDVLALQAKASAEGPGKAAAQVADLRKEYSALPEIHDLRKVDAAYNKILQSTDPAVTPSPLRDQATIFSWMKILDPGSTVREGEYASVKNARGIPDRIRNIYNQAVTGQILTPEQRLELRSASEPLFLGQVQNVAPRIRQFLAQEAQTGLTGQVVPPEDAALLQRISPGGSPAPGTAPARSPGTTVTLTIGQTITVPRDITTADGRTFRKGQAVKIRALDANGNPTDIE